MKLRKFRVVGGRGGGWGEVSKQEAMCQPCYLLSCTIQGLLVTNQDGLLTAGADPGFPIGGTPTGQWGGGGGCQHIKLPNFPINCMKLRKCRAVGGGGDARLLCPANDWWVTLSMLVNKSAQNRRTIILTALPTFHIRSKLEIFSEDGIVQRKTMDIHKRGLSLAVLV